MAFNLESLSNIEAAILSVAQAIMNRSSTVVDANGWTVLDTPKVTIYTKKITVATGSRAAGATWFGISAAALPVGVANFNAMSSIQMTLSVPTNAGLLMSNIEGNGTTTTTIYVAHSNQSTISSDFGSVVYNFEIKVLKV